MTTTSEKIRDIQLGLKRTENDLNEAIGVINALQIEITKVKQGIKPADPEPLECWVNVYQKPRKCTFRVTTLWRSEKEADDYADVGRLRKACLREVTPQDDQDRKDAELWREHMKVVKTNI